MSKLERSVEQEAGGSDVHSATVGDHPLGFFEFAGRCETVQVRRGKHDPFQSFIVVFGLVEQNALGRRCCARPAQYRLPRARP